MICNFFFLLKHLQKQQQAPTVAPPLITPQVNNAPNNIANNNQQPSSVNVQNHATNKPNTTNLPVSNHNKPSILSNEKQPNVPIQSVAPTTVPQVPKPVAIPTQSPDKPKPNVLSPLPSTYTDPLEQSLANLEHDIIKSENVNSTMIQMPPVLTNAMGNTNINCNSNINPPMLQPNLGMDIKSQPTLGISNMLANSMMHAMHSTLEHEMPSLIPPVSHPNAIHTNNNGFPVKQEFDMSTNNNGLSMGGIPMNMSIPSMFDPLPQQLNNMQQIKKEPTKTPKIEENEHVGTTTDKKLTPPEPKHGQTFNFRPKQESNLKNASSWSSLAQASSPQNSSATGGSNNRQQAMVSFKAFQKQAKEKAEKEKQRRENLELKRQQKEQAEKERLRVENEKRREREEEEMLEKAR